MYMLEVKKPLMVIGFATMFLLNSCTSGSSNGSLKQKTLDKSDSSLYNITSKNVDGSVIYSRDDNKYTAYALNKQKIKGFNHGRTPTANEIKAWDLDIMPDGTGLPEGSGSVEQGDELYEAQCAMCHGDFGTGGTGYPTLAGGQGSLKNQLLKEGDEPPVRTIGSYWPYASTLFWYIQSAMPFPNPKSLSDNEVYALTAYLLSINDIKIDGKELDDEYVLDKEKFLKIKMPNVDGFYPIDPSRNDLKEQRVPLAQGERCMSDCKETNIVRISSELTGFDPKISTLKNLKPSVNDVVASKGQTMYEANCSACHANKAIGAPVLGDKEAWSLLLEKGIDKVYNNGIVGINAMPAKGGSLMSDGEFKEVVDYIISVSK